MSYAAGRTDGKEPCKQSPHCVGSWEEVWIKTTESHTVLAIGQQRKNCNSENTETQKKKNPWVLPPPQFWQFSGNSEVMEERKQSNVSGSKSAAVTHAAPLGKQRDRRLSWAQRLSQVSAFTALRNVTSPPKW